ncbi:molybdopterin molybdotransferase MoeA [Corynebacterium lubricantis]|uniref:molybdopterin molybdotransferase MoeA n=1 Tax=Corynebacterium lubricantis TaxID=541095 RepID=UPI000361BF94|nr:molybdopterin molybdotransferase MoeA [Corynebacterium lubricantis]
MARTPEQHAQAVESLLGRRGTISLGLVDAAHAQAVTAEDVIAEHPSPRFDNSQMDGYALSIDHINGTPGQFRVGPTVAAGTDPDQIYPDGVSAAIAPIMTGARIPRGTAAIVPVEKCVPPTFGSEGAFVEVPAVPTGQFIRRQGSDIPAGGIVVPAGTKVTAPVVATLAAQSIAEVEVMRPGRIVIVTGGAEIGAPGAATIPDSNAPMLRALAEHYGIQVVGHVSTNDDPAALRADLEQAIDEYQPDALVTSGGISAGKFEVVRQVLEPSGWFGHVAQQPGGPQGLAKLNGTPVIALPGNPVSTWVSFRLYVAPFLGTVPPSLEAVLSEETTGIPGREQFRRAHLNYADATVSAMPIGGAASHLISQAVTADCLIRIPQSTTVQAGSLVTVYPL